MNSISSILLALGLLESEVKVYTTSLITGATTVVELAKKTQLSRQAVYTAIENLMERGLMSTVQRGKKRLFTSEDPDRLLEYAKGREDALKSQISRLKNALPELKLQSRGEKPIVRLYEGKEGVRVFLEDIKNERPKHIVEISDLEALHTVLSKEDLEPLRKTLVKLNPSLQGLYAGELGSERSFDRKILPKKYSGFKSNITVYHNKVALVTFEGKMYSVIIESPHLAKTMRILFDLIFSEDK